VPRFKIVLKPIVSDVTSRSDPATVSPSILVSDIDLWVTDPNNELAGLTANPVPIETPNASPGVMSPKQRQRIQSLYE
jgi:hypothetical protein